MMLFSNLFKKVRYILFLAFTFVTLNCCSDFGSSNQTSETDLSLPKEIEEFGETVAKNLRATVINMHKTGINYSDADDSEFFLNRYYSDFCRANPIMDNPLYRSQLDALSNPQIFIQGYLALTDIQKEFIRRIIQEVENSSSYEAVRQNLIQISTDIYDEVPEIQQERLLKIVSVLFFCCAELQNLEKQGQMIPTPQSQLRMIKTRSELDDIEDNWGATCRKFLATVWTVAVGEPTLLGEVVASVMTVYIAGRLFYEVVVCNRNSSNYDYCLDRFEDCYSTIPDGCSICLQYCLDQGTWPPFSSHKCS